MNKLSVEAELKGLEPEMHRLDDLLADSIRQALAVYPLDDVEGLNGVSAIVLQQIETREKADKNLCLTIDWIGMVPASSKVGPLKFVPSLEQRESLKEQVGNGGFFDPNEWKKDLPDSKQDYLSGRLPLGASMPLKGPSYGFKLTVKMPEDFSGTLHQYGRGAHFSIQPNKLPGGGGGLDKILTNLSNEDYISLARISALVNIKVVLSGDFVCPESNPAKYSRRVVSHFQNILGLLDQIEVNQVKDYIGPG